MNEFDHYKVLGLNKDATKKEVKEAFRKLAMKFHPDKHSQSSKAMRDSASLRFKQVSEAYEVLIDDSKRADYNLRARSAAGNYRNPHRHYYYSNSDPYANSYGPKYRPSSVSNFDGFVSKLQNMLLYLTTRTFLLNLAFAGGLLGGMFLINRSEEALWKMNNSGKSFEEAMESVNKARADKDKQQP